MESILPHAGYDVNPSKEARYVGPLCIKIKNLLELSQTYNNRYISKTLQPLSGVDILCNNFISFYVDSIAFLW